MAKGVRFNDTVQSFERLRADISARRYAPVYLLMGEEGYFIDAIADLIGSTVLNEAERSFNLITAYGPDTDAGTVINYCRQMPMMGNLQVVILREAQNMRDIEKLSLYTSRPQPSTLLAICYKGKSLDRRTQLYKTCADKGAVLESVRPYDSEVRSWLASHAASRGFTLTPKAIAMLTDYLGTDVAKIMNEIEKLAVSMPEGRRQITDDDIERNVGISKDYNNFELCKAVAAKDMRRAMTIADNFARNPKNNPLLVTVLALYGQFRQMFVCNYLQWQTRRKGTPYPSDAELAGILKTSPFVVREIKQQAATWDNRRVFNILGLLREYDAKSKGFNSGGSSDGELLRELLLKIFME